MHSRIRFIVSVTFIVMIGPLLISLKSISAQEVEKNRNEQRLHDSLARKHIVFQNVIWRYHQVLLAQPTETSDEEIGNWIDQLDSGGGWPDIDYKDTARAGWKPYQHLQRMKAIAGAVLRQDSKYYNNNDVRSNAIRALAFWTVHRPKSLNWWYNRIGTPRLVRDTIVLLGEHLDIELRDKSIDVLNQNRQGGTGANLLWTAETALHLGCLTNNSEQVKKAADAIWHEILVGQNEGIQEDWSFFQHGVRLQTFSYGKFFLEIAVNTAWQLQGTQWEMPDEKKIIISNYMLEGMQWMSRGIHTVPSTMDRQFSRPNRLSYSDIRPQLKLWMDVDKNHDRPIQKFLDRQNNNANPINGFRHFLKADLTTYHRPEGSIFLKTISNRTKATETTNQENLKGRRFLHSGDHYLLNDGTELEGIQPTLDWSRMPGITVADPKTTQARRPFTGGLGDGDSGLVAMDYARLRDTSDPKKDIGSRTEFEVRKSWFFHGDKMICLLSGWKTGKELTHDLTTSIQQRLLDGDVIYADKSGNINKLPVGKIIIGKIQWAIHDGVGYFLLGNENCQLFAGPATGTWAAINDGFRDRTDPVTKSVFRMYLNHGSRPEPTGYAVVLGADVKKMVALQKSQDWRVELNSRRCQAISFSNHVMAAFFESGEFTMVRAAGGRRLPTKLQTDSPCLLTMSENKALVNCPDQLGRKIRVGIDLDSREIEIPTGGLPVSIDIK